MIAVSVIAVSVIAVTVGAVPASAATTEEIVANPQTGLAIDGFDPVSYFVDGAPEPGRPDHELRFHGVVWRFRNAGNMAVFVEYPGTYAPRFGGYDPIAVARGAPTPGNPTIWLVAGRRLYLFLNPASREAFRTDPGRFAAQAEARWPDVLKLLSH